LSVRNLLHVGDAEIVLLASGNAAPLAQEPLDVRLHFRRVDAVQGRDIDGVDIGVARDTPVIGAQRHEHDVIAIAAEARLTLGREDADYFAGDIADAKPLADRVY
jgi:hypothetical protein